MCVVCECEYRLCVLGYMLSVSVSSLYALGCMLSVSVTVSIVCMSWVYVVCECEYSLYVLGCMLSVSVSIVYMPWGVCCL